MISIRTFSTSALILALISSRVAQATSSPQESDQTPFVVVVMHDFDSWDTDRDGVLSTKEINQLVVDPAVKGDDAAAAGALKLLARNHKIKLPPLTKEYFDQYNRQAMMHNGHRPLDPAVALTATTDSGASVPGGNAGNGQLAGAHLPATQPASGRLPNFDLYFTAAKARIARGGAFRYTGREILEDTRQGPVGDCFFVATVTSLAFHDPARFQQLLAPQSDGRFIVNFPNAKPLTVGAPTESELAISATTTNDGTWLAVMEQAFGKYKARESGADPDTVEGTDILDPGGDSMPTIRALTGHAAGRFNFGRTVEIRAAAADDLLPKVRAALIKGIEEHRVMTAGGIPQNARSKPGQTATPVPPDLIPQHVYAILSYDQSSDVIEFWNPHGENFTPRGSPGIEFGYPTQHGRFKVPLKEACQFFGSFTIEGAVVDQTK